MRFLILILLFFSCDKTTNENFVIRSEEDIVKFTNFINEIETSNTISIIVEEVAVTSNEDELLRIITLQNTETIESLFFHLNIDTDGNTSNISYVSYQLYEDEVLVTYSYSLINDDLNNPASLDYSIEESTEESFKINMSGILSNYNAIDNSYTPLQISDIDLDIAF